jgi:hypothetical protein
MALLAFLSFGAKLERRYLNSLQEETKRSPSTLTSALSASNDSCPGFMKGIHSVFEFFVGVHSHSESLEVLDNESGGSGQVSRERRRRPASLT